ncbi:hypothetical protein [Streptomyces sp. NBC_00425]|uniref:hypothetical protein n=1 Tax=Streptomyces sp. NBC_00425 TaxID=2975740 RepID=UPI002E1FD804
MTDNHDQPRVPGVRYRTETRYRPVTTYVFGEEQTDYEPYQVDVPVPPRDWDRALMRFVMTVAFASTVVAVVWSTASISRLLALVVSSAAIAVAAASLFELLWIMCLAAEWLLRGRPNRAKPMQVAGWITVWFVVAGVIVEGVHEKQIAAGIVGGAVSLMAKGSWWVVYRVRQVELRRPIAAWLQRNQEETAAAEALLGFKSQMGGRQAYAELVYGRDAVLAARATVEAANRLGLDPSGPRPDPSGRPVQAAPAPQAAPIPAAPVQAPAAPVQPPAPAAVPTASAPVGPPVTQLGPSIRQTVVAILDRDWNVSDEDLVDEVRRIHGDRPKLADTVATYRRKEAKARRGSGPIAQGNP